MYLFPGTFNPIHNAHLRVAEFVIKNGNADRVIFIPSLVPPHKTSDTTFSEHKLNMVKLATNGKNGFEVSDIEYELGGKSYTYRTVCELKKRFGRDKLFKILIGTDAFRKIESWHKTELLKDEVEFEVFFRDKNFNPHEFDYLKEKEYRFKFMPLKFEDISSEDIRDRIKNGLSTKNLIPKEIEEYIRDNGLYKS